MMRFIVREMSKRIASDNLSESAAAAAGDLG
jgi:hypothetical protein